VADDLCAAGDAERRGDTAERVVVTGQGKELFDELRSGSRR